MFESELKSKVAFTAKMLIKAGLIEGFGHVSLRVKKGFLITSTRPLAKSTSKNVIFYNILDPPKKSPKDLPLETPMHAAITSWARSNIRRNCKKS